MDDDPAFAQFTRNLLTDKEMKVVFASSKAEVLAAFEREGPSCVILDIFFPSRRHRRGSHQADARLLPNDADHHGLGPDTPNLSGKATLKEVSKIAQRHAEKELIERVLGQTRWNRRKAAEILDTSYKALIYKIKDCGLNIG